MPKKNHQTRYRMVSEGFTPVIILLVILVLVTVAGAFYLGTKKGNVNYSPTPTVIDTTSWKTYKNTKFGYEIKYPAQWGKPALPDNATTITYANEKSQGTILFGNFGGTDQPLDGVRLWILPFSGTVDQLINYDPDHLQMSLDKNTIQELSTTELTGKEIIVSPDKKEMVSYAYYSVKNGVGVVFHSTPAFDNTKFNQILSTFKFTK